MDERRPQLDPPGRTVGVVDPGSTSSAACTPMAWVGWAMAVLVAGFAAQDKLVQGLSLGAVK